MSIAYKKNGVWVTASGTPPIDDALSATSENPVQNKVVKQAVDGIQTVGDKTQQMIAPIQTTLTALKAYAVGEQFVYNGLLYKATAAIAQGGAITIGGNCELADSVTKQLHGLLSVSTVDYSLTKSANTVFAELKTITVPTGYKFVGVLGWTIVESAGYINTISVCKYSYSGANIIRIAGIITAEVTFTIRVELLFTKSASLLL